MSTPAFGHEGHPGVVTHPPDRAFHVAPSPKGAKSSGESSRAATSRKCCDAALLIAWVEKMGLLFWFNTIKYTPICFI
jgi:hypothetical protein